MGLSPLDVRLARDRVLQPDVFLFRGGRPGGPHEVIRGAPDLVIEVLCERRGYDRLTKRLIYAEAGVSEYWIVDPYARTVEVVNGLVTARIERSQLSSTLVPGLSIDLERIWPDLG